MSHPCMSLPKPCLSHPCLSVSQPCLSHPFVPVSTLPVPASTLLVTPLRPWSQPCLNLICHSPVCPCLILVYHTPAYLCLKFVPALPNPCLNPAFLESAYRPASSFLFNPALPFPPYETAMFSLSPYLCLTLLGSPCLILPFRLHSLCQFRP